MVLRPPGGGGGSAHLDAAHEPEVAALVAQPGVAEGAEQFDAFLDPGPRLRCTCSANSATVIHDKSPKPHSGQEGAEHTRERIRS